jgi:hypothetical protein
MAGHNRLDKLDFDQSRRPLLEPEEGDTSPRGSNGGPSYAGSFLDQVAEGIQARDREDFKRGLVRYVSFAVAVLSW